jgi:hypothetical protein
MLILAIVAIAATIQRPSPEPERLDHPSGPGGGSLSVSRLIHREATVSEANGACFGAVLMSIGGDR